MKLFLILILIGGPLLCLDLVASDPASPPPLYQGQTKFLGSAMSRGPLPGDFLPGYNRYFNAQYIEGVFWERCEPERGKFVFSLPGTWADPIGQYEIARANHKIIYVHALAWSDKFIPEWWWSLPTDTEKRSEMETWIATALGEFPDASYVDVLNEAIHSADLKKMTYIDHLYGSNGLYGTGYDWAVWIFEKAQQHKRPGQKLIINEYDSSPEGIQAYAKLCTILYKRGLINGIGVQGHGSWQRLTDAELTDRLDQLSKIGPNLYITEFDISNKNDASQLQDMQRLFPLYWNHDKVKGFIFYDWLENNCWLKNAFLVHADGTERPAFQWVRKYLQGTPGSTSASGN